MLFANLTKLKQEVADVHAVKFKNEKEISTLKSIINAVKSKCKHYKKTDNTYTREIVSDIYKTAAKGHTN